jgi:hypothetical protein
MFKFILKLKRFQRGNILHQYFGAMNINKKKNINNVITENKKNAYII